MFGAYLWASLYAMSLHMSFQLRHSTNKIGVSSNFYHIERADHDTVCVIDERCRNLVDDLPTCARDNPISQVFTTAVFRNFQGIEARA
jgi:hypothetical protein